MKKKERTNSAMEIKMFYSPLKIALGYEKEDINWGHGHFTRIKHFYFLFWNIRTKQAIIKF
jgi:hypothetical protein